MPSVKQADKAEQNLDAGGDHTLQVEQIGKHVEDKDGALVLGIEVVVEGHGPRTAPTTLLWSPSYSMARALR
jgi:hypothetical protein